MRLIVIVAPALLLGACASTTGTGLSYGEEYERLVAECQAGGGILVPITRSLSSNPAADYACERRDSPRLD